STTYMLWKRPHVGGAGTTLIGCPPSSPLNNQFLAFDPAKLFIPIQNGFPRLGTEEPTNRYPIRATFPACCASAASGAAMSTAAVPARKVRRSTIGSPHPPAQGATAESSARGLWQFSD